MKIKSFRLAFAIGVIVSAPAAHAYSDYDESDRSSRIRVDVVVDMTIAGHKVAHPTPEKPAYYLPISVGYKEFGYMHDFQRPPPKAWDIEHALAIALYEQGYRLMTKQGHPTLVLVFWWGYMAPEDLDADNPGGLLERPGSLSQDPSAGFFSGSGQAIKPGITVAGINDYFIGGTGGGGVFPSFSMMSIPANDIILSSMVGGNTINDHQKFLDPRLDTAMQLTTQPRYYILISAFDFKLWLHHRAILLWRAHVSTELWGHYFDQVVGTLISTAAPEFGRETKVPHFSSVDLAPLGRVLVGTPVVKDFSGRPADNQDSRAKSHEN